jgi:hypothetical protein
MTNAETLELIVNENAMKFTTIIYDVVWASAIVLLLIEIIGCKKSCKK